MSYKFSELPNRKNTGSIKWDRYRGTDVLPMWVADMDFVSPPEIVAALHQRVDHGVFGYTDPTSDVLAAVSKYMLESHGVSIEHDWLLWTPGLVPALNTAVRAYCQPHESIVTTVPIYPPFLSAPKYQGRELRIAPLQNNSGIYGYDWQALDDVVTSDTRAFFMCNPHNPVGRVWTTEELKETVAFCQRNDLLLISDEIHCDLILDPQLKHQTALTIDPWVSEHGVTLMSPSKTYNLCGLACSFVIIPNRTLRRQFHRAMRGLLNELNCLGYAACTSAYNDGGDWKNELLEVLRENFAIVSAACRESMPLLRVTPAEATYLAWIDVRNFPVENARATFEQHGVGLSDGIEFGMPGFLRLNFGCPASRVHEAMQRMCDAYKQHVP